MSSLISAFDTLLRGEALPVELVALHIVIWKLALINNVLLDALLVLVGYHRVHPELFSTLELFLVVWDASIVVIILLKNVCEVELKLSIGEFELFDLLIAYL